MLRGFTAFDTFLTQHPEFREEVTFIAHLQPSRQDVPEYAEYLERIEALVAVVNHRHGTTDWMPIDLKIYENFPEAVARYKHFDLLMVNSIFDGMNLVAKEAPAVNTRDGVLMLSENTGSHEELGRLRPLGQPVRHPGAGRHDLPGADHGPGGAAAAVRAAEGDHLLAQPGGLGGRPAGATSSSCGGSWRRRPWLDALRQLNCSIWELGEKSSGFRSWAGVAGIRIRWKALGKGVALAVAGLLALQVLPALLKPPEPPPLGADVGLPRVAVEAEPAPRPTAPAGAARTQAAPAQLARSRDLTTKVSSNPKSHRHRKPHPTSQPPAPHPRPRAFHRSPNPRRAHHLRPSPPHLPAPRQRRHPLLQQTTARRSSPRTDRRGRDTPPNGLYFCGNPPTASRPLATAAS